MDKDANSPARLEQKGPLYGILTVLFVMVFFLPIFFTFTGLRTNILGLTSIEDMQWLGIVLIVAVAGKIVPVYIAGRMTGFSHDESFVLGSLMNTRALMELIVLNIGYDLGFVPQSIALYPSLSGLQNLEFFARLHGIPKRQAQDSRASRSLHPPARTPGSRFNSELSPW